MIRQKLDNLDAWITAYLQDVKTRGPSNFTWLFYQMDAALDAQNWRTSPPQDFRRALTW